MLKTNVIARPGRSTAMHRLAVLGGAALPLLAAQWLVATPAGAQVLSQDPLTSRVAQPAKPNVVFTIDDSGSMQTHYMPEGTFTVNGFNVSFPTAAIDSNYYMSDGFPGDITHEGGWLTAGTVTALKDGGETVYQMQFRSPDVNTVFYNPDVTYLPWVMSTNVRYPAATLSAALWEPTKTGSFNLSGVRSYTTGTVSWLYGTYNRSTSYGETCTGSGWSRVCTVKFNPGLVYRLKAGANPTLPGSYVRYDVNGSSTEYAPDTKHAGRTDCPAARCTQAQEKQNFANWFTYYRNRLLLTKASVAEVLNATGNTVRVGLASINTGVVVGGTPAQMVDGQLHQVMRKGVRDLTKDHRDMLLEDVRTMVSNGGTPLKLAIKQVGFDYFMRSNDGNPWRDDPNPKSGNKLETQCRRSYNILMTDGYYNNDGLVTDKPGNVDSVAGPSNHVPDPALKDTKPPVTAAYGYKPSRPYLDGSSDSLADYAMYFYVNDLRPNLANRITPLPTTVRSNAPYWQHLTHFTVGLGVKGDLDSRSEPRDAAGKSPKQRTLEEITAGTKQWPSAITTDPQRIDDLWHAAVDTGGDFFAAKNSTELTQALVSALGSAGEVLRTEGGVGTSSATLVVGASKFVPFYRSTLWTGELSAYKLVASGNRLVFSDVPAWQASKAVPAHGARKLFTYDGSAGDEFDTGMTPAMRKLITEDANQADLINYLRGDKTKEGEIAPQFRRREGPLPDFVNSTPTFVKGLFDGGYSKLAGAQGAAYKEFLKTKAARAGVIYVGGNGGFLHGFAESDGKELYGYAPKAVFGNLKKLSALDYGTATNFHRFFVDGPLLEADAFIAPRKSSVAGWTNLLIGTLGAGGQGIFALNVTNPSTLGADTIQWEFTNADHPSMGNIFTAPEVGRLGGRWMAFFGNGAHSVGGKAVLFAVDLQDRTLKSFELESEQGSNGLMGVRLLFNDQLEAQAAFAGDLQGNLWRIDFENSADPNSWKKGFSRSPLFVAKDASNVRQPITVKPSLVAHPRGGFSVLFGTGKLYDSDDANSTSSQTYYGVWDETLLGNSAATSSAAAWSSLSNQRSKFVEQKIGEGTVGGDGDTYFGVSSTAPDWAIHRGWYMDLDIEDGQRVVYPSVVVDDFVLIQTIVPAGTPAVCDSSSGHGYDFLLPAATGAQDPSPVWDTNGDGRVDDGDLVVAGYKAPADGANTIMTGEAPNECKSVGGSEDKDCDVTRKVQIRDRVWRQIVNPPQPGSK